MTRNNGRGEVMRILIATLSAIALAAVIGCSKQEEEGPAERAGKQVDESMEKAKDYTSDKVEEMGEAIEHAGEEMQK
jgi:uncharacterized protein YjbJ (UPF0337 family)